MNISQILSKYQTDKNLGNIDGSGHCYGPKYDEIFQKFDRNSDKITLLEIGIQKGGSISAWKDYFINGKIFGVDIVDDIKPEYRRNDVEYIIEDIKSPTILKKFEGYNFDIIIDDGNHWWEYVAYVVENFSSLLKLNGYLIIEDCQQPHIWLHNIQNMLSENFEVTFSDTTQECGRYDDFLTIIKRIK